MEGAQLPGESTALIRSGARLCAAALIFALGMRNVQVPGTHPGLVLALFVVWMAVLLASARPTRKVSGPSEWAMLFFFLVSVVALALLAVYSSEPILARFFLIAAPLAFFSLEPLAPYALVAASGATLVASFVVPLVSGQGFSQAAQSAACGLASSFMALLGAASIRRVRSAEIALAEEHQRTVAALLEKEKRLAEVERLAAAGSKAARVAHDMANPVASMRCNLEWLCEAVSQDRLDSDRAEVVEVMKETRECLDRLLAQLQDFRVLARAARAVAPEAGEPDKVASVKATGETLDGSRESEGMALSARAAGR